MKTLTGITLLLLSQAVLAADRPAESRSETGAQSSTAPVDNSRINTRDRSGATKTPEDQAGGTESDRRLLAAVRKAVEGDKTLSTSAHNVKIVTKDGVVTLRGPVNNEDEKGKVARLAEQVAGVSSVQNQLDVKTR